MHALACPLDEQLFIIYVMLVYQIVTFPCTIQLLIIHHERAASRLIRMIMHSRIVPHITLTNCFIYDEENE